MKTFEEKWTAWIDGELSGQELVEFEASFRIKAAAELEKRTQAHKLARVFEVNNSSARAMANEEFFHHQLRERIASESAPRQRIAAAAHWRESWWTIQSFALDRRDFARGLSRLHFLCHAR